MPLRLSIHGIVRNVASELSNGCWLSRAGRALASVLTGERYRLLRHLHKHPEPSVSALARSLGRQYRRVHADVTALEEAGLLDRSANMVRTTVDRISAEITL